MNKTRYLQVGDIITTDKAGPGEWVVIDTKMTGGGEGHGPGDIFPDGWRVELQHMESKARTYFYQSGCFVPQVMLEEGEYEEVGKAKIEIVAERL